MKTLFVQCHLLNGKKFRDWAISQGFDKTLGEKDFHITLAFSKEKVDWDKIDKKMTSNFSVEASDNRMIEPLGDKGAVVLRFSSEMLENRWKEFVDSGCSWDYDGYKPHITITYSGQEVDLENVEPFAESLEFGPEIWKEVVLDWDKKVKEKTASER